MLDPKPFLCVTLPILCSNIHKMLSSAQVQGKHVMDPQALYEYPKRMSKFIVHRRGVPLIIHKRIPYIVHKRMEVGGNGFDGDTFSSGFGDFSTTRKKKMGLGGEFGDGDTFSQGFGDFSTQKRMDTSFHGDTFSNGFGDFSTV